MYNYKWQPYSLESFFLNKNYSDPDDKRSKTTLIYLVNDN